ncbi:hypothetical protein CLV49_2513 [Labedella gwakjiensis]|uniref:Uncharacterized protein n=1 Tax=Labedella gwakjiensis TaxID=390269 RepID=A0A2P8GY25_9MICO|nr:hypothetical protein [Labedella gwakjiensis]PSL38883.1 hypothetical protein CLV49_2513 [Labedella gwakjiensis]RUQ86649.1 hypothetical protein ELQ93_06655 [Labedella gwakjiensis]
MIDRDALADIAAETIHAVDPGGSGRPAEAYADVAGELADRVQAAVSQLELTEWLSTVLPGEGAERDADARTIVSAVFADLHEVSSSPLIEQIDPEA